MSAFKYLVQFIVELNTQFATTTDSENVGAKERDKVGLT